MQNVIILYVFSARVIFVDPVVADDVQKCNMEFMQQNEVCSFCCKLCIFYLILRMVWSTVILVFVRLWVCLLAYIKTTCPIFT